MSQIRLKSRRDPARFYVDWWLMNHCNYQCSYCADVIKNGSAPLLDIRNCEDFVEQLAAHCERKQLIMDVNLTGGEVTQWSQLERLLKAIKKHQSLTTIRSNASLSVSEWQAITENLDSVRLDFHPEYAAVSHFAQIVAASVKAGTQVSVSINMLPERFEELEQLAQKLSDLYPDISVTRKMLFNNPVVNTEPMNYDQQQLESFENQHGDLVFYHKGRETITDYATLVLHDLNKFYNDLCGAGIEQIVVDAWGRVFRAHCRQDGKLGLIGQQITWPTDPVTCQFDICRNAFDVSATKYIPIKSV